MLSSILEVIELQSEMAEPISFARTVCDGPDYDKFLEAALAANAYYLVSGDTALLSVKELPPNPDRRALDVYPVLYKQ